MSVINKSFLDYTGLQSYDTKIKETISGVEDQIPAISVDEETETLIIRVPLSAVAQASEQAGSGGTEES